MKICAFAGAFSIAFTAASIADNHAPDAPEWGMGNPVEIYGCQFKDGVDGYKQAIKHANLVNDWAEEHGAFQNHVGQIMYPEFSDGEYPSEFWLGYWQNYEDYGADMDKRAEYGAELYVEADKFLEQCAHSEWGMWELFPAEGEWTLDNHVTEFSDCVYKDGKGDSDLLVANVAFAKEMACTRSHRCRNWRVLLWPRYAIWPRDQLQMDHGLPNAVSLRQLYKCLVERGSNYEVEHTLRRHSEL